MAKTLEELVQETIEKRKHRAAVANEVHEEGWIPFDSKLYSLTYESPAHASKFTTLKFGRDSSLRDIFLTYFNFSMRSMLLEKHLSTLYYSDGSHMHITDHKLLQYFALRIRIHGFQKAAYLGSESHNSQRDAVNRCISLFPPHTMISSDVYQKIESHLFMDFEDESKMRCNILDTIVELGEIVSGDEKLFEYRGESGYIRVCKAKHAQIGLWSYQLCGKLASDNPYSIYFRGHRLDYEDPESITTADVMLDWIHIIEKFGNKTYLVFDSYYFSYDSRCALLEHGVRFMGSAPDQRFASVVNILKQKVSKDREWAIMYNQKTHEAAVHYLDPNPDIGRKTCVSWGFILKNVKTPANIVPIYDYYKHSFSMCDKFNKLLEHGCYPFRHTGSEISGDHLALFDFQLSSLLMNTLCAYRDTTPGHGAYTYGSMCTDLSNQLYELSIQPVDEH